MDYHACVNIVTWNGEEYIDDLLKSLEAQSFQGFQIIVIDNASSDKTLEILKKYPRIVILKNSSNQGFSRAHNKGIDLALKFWQGKSLDDRFIFVVNQDVVLKEDCLERMLKSIYIEKNTAVVGPKLLRIYEEEIDNLPHKSRSNTIDSLGIKISKSRKTTDKFSGQEEKPDLAKQEVFGVSGAFMCLRASALNSIKHDREYFDEDFFAYKEDVDLCWRLQNMGWKIMLAPEAVAYHYRKVRGDAKISLWKKFQNQKNKSCTIKFLSLRNHLWTILKNDFTANHLMHWPFIFFREFGKFGYNLFLDTKNVQAYFSAIAGIPKMLKKRAYLKNAKVGAREVRRWIG
ncbi:glycosyltransferase family 2 protein [Patescibacteria group bacterium]|nr:glycosyltransferase family 2 protein [Patescibacteria group bacterium]